MSEPLAELTRQFIWTVIPSGRINISRQRAVFSVLLTPKLIGPRDTTVNEFAMQSWPTRLKGITFRAWRGETEISDTTRVPYVTEDNRTITLTDADRLSAWRAVFPATMPVRALSPTSYQGRRVNDFPATEAGAQIQAAFTETACAVTQLEGDDATQLVERSEELRRIAVNWQNAALGTADQEAAAGAGESPLTRAYKFYSRNDTDFTPLEPEDFAAEPQPDFHDKVTRLGDHPILLRALGLLIDFEVPLAALTAGTGPKDLRVKLTWPADPVPAEGWSSAAQQDVSPKTAYVVAAGRFVAATPPNDGPQGVLPLAGTGLTGEGSNDRFEIMPFDVDGAALRMFSIAQSERGRVSVSALPTAGLPTLRSMGLALVDTARRTRHDAQLKRANERDTPEKLQATALTADNLTAGYRIDVAEKLGDAQGPWRSLCRRRVRYVVGGVSIGHEAGLPGLLEEGYVRPDVATTGNGSRNALYIHETVAKWDGWGVVTPRPDRVADAAPVETAEPAADGFTVSVSQEPGSLPRLRFGRKYQLRVRLTDLAGGGLRPAEADGGDEHSDPVMHRRFEPLLAPELAPTAPYVDGAGHQVMVIRSDRHQTAEEYAGSNGYRATDLRYLLAPKSSLDLAIQHDRENSQGQLVGVFDSALGPAAHDDEVRRQFDIAKRADFDLGKLPEAKLVDGEHDSGKYFVAPESEEKVWVPWLADVAADFTGLRVAEGGRPIDPENNRPGKTEGFKDTENPPRDKFMYTWKGEWPNRVPIRLRLIEESNPAAAVGCTALKEGSGDRRTFTIKLKPAEQVTLDIVSGPDPDLIPKLGVAHWAGAHPTDPLNNVNDNIYRGRNPLVTPPRKVTMIHAVQTPLRDPSGGFVAKRSIGDTHAVLDATGVDIHVPSTGRLDIRATWEDIEDLPGKGVPQRKSGSALIGSFEIAHKPAGLEPPSGAFPVIRHEFGDARRRKVTYTVDAISRFRDYFGTVTAQTPDACTVNAVLRVTDVPSSVRPPAPQVRNIVPAFGWKQTVDGSVSRSSRKGGQLRVMLERPWFITGADESLAVIVLPENGPAPSVPDRELLSLAGRDPIWNVAAAPAQVVMTKAAFGAGTKTTTALLPELGKQVVVAVYPLDDRKNFDSEADCWFADIDLSPLAASSYLPFVRLVLCRFQAETAGTAVRDLRLSSPIATEPLQLFPHRDLTVTRAPGKATVMVNDPNPTAPKHTEVRAELQVFQGDPRAAEDALIGGTKGWTRSAQATKRLGEAITLDVEPTETRKLRVVVTEAETYPGTGTTSRIVYADTVAL